ncbi:hypothetical protein PTTG_26453 [Puccinia triticina 1-1 BBBD Race 1]|uniref:Uncharacterized protein n=1 Tax=Puccinia triticina (isolate 1-1 / race 1 (BBBD)) TaxID=630390 RepID=A0A180GVP4_PUCT1|nr:hypothetical protein PTTG_26453 [Puccinia triticina 1-1 BBBD Race 1]
MPQAVVRNHDQIQSEYQQQVIEDPCKRDRQVMKELSSDFCEKPISNDDGVLIHADLSLELNYSQELDHQSDLEIDLGPEHSHQILSLMVPMEIKSSIDENREAVVEACSNAKAPSTALLLLLPSLWTPLVLRRPAEQFPHHGNEDASVISTQRRIPYQSVRLARLNLQDDDGNSEDKAPRLMSTRHRPAWLNKHYLQDACQPNSNLNNRNSNNPQRPVSDLYNHRLDNHSLYDVGPYDQLWNYSHLHSHPLDDLPPLHLDHVPELPSPYQQSPCPSTENHHPYFYDQPDFENNIEYNPDTNNYYDNYYSSSLNDCTNVDNDNYTNDQVDNFNDQQVDYDASYDVYDDGLDLECYDDD